MRLLRTAVIAVCAVVLTGVAACGSGDHPAPSSSSTPIAQLREDLPAPVRDTHVLRVAVHSPFAPMVFRRDGRLEGFDVDVVARVADLLGLGASFVEYPFDDLPPIVAGGHVDIAVGGLSDTAAREEQTDMVTYLRAGTRWIRRTGGDVTPYQPADNASARSSAACS